MVDIEGDPKRVRGVILRLGEVFDDKAKVYKNGHSDETVAKDCDVSISFVSEKRDHYFGKLAEDPRVTSLRAQIDALEVETKKEIEKLTDEIGEIDANFTGGIAKLREQMAKLISAQSKTAS